jgi:hypothetical protein
MKNSPLSLSEIPLFKYILNQKKFPIVLRNVDARWNYYGISLGLNGFNPYLGKIFIAENSCLAEWIKGGKKNDRHHNIKDLLIREISFLAHDFIHAWSVQFLRTKLPSLDIGSCLITKENFEDLAFCHLLTEAAATVAIDYWFLSTMNIGKECNLGSDFKTLTVSFHESNSDEFKRFNPDFNAQTPEFLGHIARFYCNGIFTGYGIEDLEKSPIIRTWLEKEISYGNEQRISTRSWLSYLSNNKVTLKSTDLDKPIKLIKNWQKQIINELSIALWDLIKNNIDCLKDTKHITKQMGWHRSEELPIDPRFTNLSRINQKHLKEISCTLSELNSIFPYLISQFISAHDFDTFPETQMDTLSTLILRYDLQSIQSLFSNLKTKKLRQTLNRDYKDLFFVN